ncbi:MAG: T9SS type A sorting domain-containing protein [Saprospiraceae bacterium]|nr:T9SS type A sorting domain-containing protein [Saprospiraceae bacterium]
MFKKFLSPIAAFLLLAFNASAQHRTCAAEEVLAQQLLDNPAMLQEIQRIEEHTRQFAQSGGAIDRAVITIPVVFHVVYYNSTQNLSDAKLISQLDVLNADFRRTNADKGNTPAAFQGIAADCEINFCIATQDPNGAATNGIQRRQTTVNGFGTNDNVKYYSSGGLDIWDRNKYLNIWVCNLSGGLLGYAQFPGGPAATDGVVCDYAYFGTIGATPPFDKGRTATHEVGHWLNCYHIWGDDGSACTGSDGSSDTPNQADENYGCPSFPQISCSNGPNGDMFMNYMDYTDDACMNVFSAGQKTRMQSLFSSGGARIALASSPGCQEPSGCGTPSGLTATNITQTSATCNWNAVGGATTYTFEWKKNSDLNYTVVPNLTATTHNLNGLTTGTLYDYRVKAICNGQESSYGSAQFTTASNCADQYETNNTNSTAKSVPINTAFTAQIASTTDKDYYLFGNTSSQKNIKVELTTLPFDYDLKLYKGTSLKKTSQNGGTADELIILNNATVGTDYKAYVYGYNGAWSNTQCYTFKASRSSSAWRTDGSTDGAVEEISLDVVFENVGFGLFPNPAMEQLTVEVPLEAEGNVSVTIIDPSGKMALTQQNTLTKGENQFTFDVSSLPNGVYFVQVRNGEIAKTRKLIVQR